MKNHWLMANSHWVFNQCLFLLTITPPQRKDKRAET
ncbi:membrane-spanning 4-domains, subfamily A, member 12 (predicted) [Rattus norvegicus]|uniref:Membrane-spanning 4-domains, subfamily A, member 12 (Predicted) n=1 Tax=Rattus norvegicus TaxID=10116 RepID=A6I084_RAT|nr:membrane-spanning 4-domains, subfamily A, member 12 (predicted) [Rattus norvegicus]